MNTAELRAAIAAIAAERREIHEAAGEDALTDEQQTRWSELDTEETELATELEAAERRERVTASRQRFGASLLDSADPFDGADVARMANAQARDRGLKILDDRDSTRHLEDSQKTALEKTLRAQTRNTNGAAIAKRMLLTENPAYRSAFQKLVTSPNAILTVEENNAVLAVQEYREMNIGTGADGGFGVPVLIDPTIILTAQGSPNPILANARVETITNDAWRGVSSAGMSWNWRAEGATTSDNSPTLAQPVVNTHRADGYIPYTIEVGMDYPGFAGEMATLLASGYAELLAEAFTVGLGDGSNQPFGVVTALDGTASEVDTPTTGSFDATDVSNLWAALPVRYRGSSRWMSHTSVNNTVQLFGSGGADAEFTVDFTESGVQRLKGRPYDLNDYMPEFNVTGDGFLVVGDWSRYLIAQRAGMSIELVNHVFDTSGAVGLPNGQRAWFAWARVGGDVIDINGFRMLSDNGVTE